MRTWRTPIRTRGKFRVAMQETNVKLLRWESKKKSTAKGLKFSDYKLSERKARLPSKKEGKEYRSGQSKRGGRKRGGYRLDETQTTGGK